MTFKSIIKIITSFAAVLLLFTTAMAQPAGDEVRTIKIKGTDNMKFDVTSIDAVPGETIKIVYTTASKFPKQSMAHNVVILVHGVVNASAKAKDIQYIAPELKDQVIAATD